MLACWWSSHVILPYHLSICRRLHLLSTQTNTEYALKHNNNEHIIAEVERSTHNGEGWRRMGHVGELSLLS